MACYLIVLEYLGYVNNLELKKNSLMLYQKWYKGCIKWVTLKYFYVLLVIIQPIQKEVWRSVSHQKKTNIRSPELIVTKFQCKKFKKYYKGQRGLWGHIKLCSNVILNSLSVEVKALLNFQDKNISQELIEAINKMSEQMKQSNEIAK